MLITVAAMMIMTIMAMTMTMVGRHAATYVIVFCDWLDNDTRLLCLLYAYIFGSVL